MTMATGSAGARSDDAHLAMAVQVPLQSPRLRQER